VNAAGDRFEIELWARPGSGLEKIVSVMADNWKAVGVSGKVVIEPAALTASREFEATRPGFLIINPSGSAFYESVAKLHARSIPTAENRWAGSNYGAYLNPRADVLVDQLQETVDRQARIPLHAQLVREYMGDVALMPLYWQVVPILELSGISGPRENQ